MNRELLDILIETWNRQISVDEAFDEIEEIIDVPPKPAREWVGLEEQDMPDGEDAIYDDPRFIAGMVWTNNKLMEKNA